MTERHRRDMLAAMMMRNLLFAEFRDGHYTGEPSISHDVAAKLAHDVVDALLAEGDRRRLPEPVLEHGYREPNANPRPFVTTAVLARFRRMLKAVRGE